MIVNINCRYMVKLKTSPAEAILGWKPVHTPMPIEEESMADARSETLDESGEVPHHFHTLQRIDEVDDVRASLADTHERRH